MERCNRCGALQQMCRCPSGYDMEPAEPVVSDELVKKIYQILSDFEQQTQLGTKSNYADKTYTVAAFLSLITADREAYADKRAIEARIDERKNIALDNYQGKTFSEQTNWEAKFEKFVGGNELRLSHLKKGLK